MEKSTAKVKPLNRNNQPESSKSGNISILIAFIDIFFTKFIELVETLDKSSLATKFTVLLLSIVFGWAFSIIALFYITIKAVKGSG